VTGGDRKLEVPADKINPDFVPGKNICPAANRGYPPNDSPMIKNSKSRKV
jgi:hypothetical protein